MKIISIFNHKGGVSKTTSTFHIGAMLSNLGKRVLLVDADSQCNLTGLMSGFIEGQSSAESFYEKYDDIYNCVIKDITGNGALGDQDPNELRLLKYKESDNGGFLHLLPGSVFFAEVEPRLTTSILFSSNRFAQNATTMRMPGVFGKLFTILDSIHHYDYVLVDMSPSIGMLNQCLIMNSHYFLIPLAPDYFSWQALDSIKRVIPQAYKDFQPFRVEDNLNGYRLPYQPQFAGYIIQKFRLTAGKKKADVDKDKIIPSKPFQKWVDKINTKITDDLLPVFKGENMYTNDQPLIRSLIPEFNSLIAKSQNAHKPVFELEESEIYNDKHGLKQRVQAQDKKAQIELLFKGVCDTLIKATTKKH